MNRRQFIKNSLIVSAMLPVALYNHAKIPAESQVDKLARWHRSLNGWEWPEDLPGKPDDFDSLPSWRNLEGTYERDPNIRQKTQFVGPILRKIEHLIGSKECFRWFHVNELGYTNVQFELWWAGRGL